MSRPSRAEVKARLAELEKSQSLPAEPGCRDGERIFRGAGRVLPMGVIARRLGVSTKLVTHAAHLVNANWLIPTPKGSSMLASHANQIVDEARRLQEEGYEDSERRATYHLQTVWG